MFKTKPVRLAAFVVIAAGAAFFISCQDGATAPTPVNETGKGSFDSVGIYGYTYNQFGQKIIDV